MRRGMETRRQASKTPRKVGLTFTGRPIHLIGIGGAGMRALARMLLDRGAVVSGSDNCASGAVERLARQGVTVRMGQKAENLADNCEMVVYSAAINEQNPELLAARQRGVEVLKYSQMLGKLMDERIGIAVAGTHGKSTTTAMVAWTLTQEGADPSFVVGATVEQLGGPSGVGAGKHFVAEACEFDRSFLNLRPHYAAILNIEEDHLDCYRDLESIIEAFRAFSAQVVPEGVLIANGDDRNAVGASRSAACEVQMFGLGEECTWRGANLSAQRGRFQMDVMLAGKKYCKLRVPLPGLHNAYNALAAVALLHHAGIDRERIAETLGRFAGTHRRMMLKAQLEGIAVVDDYAHHPTEIQATLRALRDYYSPQRLLCIFQPHQHSRTRFLLKDFARSFAAADEVIIPDIYFVRDSERERDYICSGDLVSQIRLHGGSAVYLKTFEEIVRRLEEILRPGDLVVTMGAGNIWEVADEIVRWLGTNR